MTLAGVLTGLGQARDAHPRALDGHGFAEFDDGDVVVERAQPELLVPIDFGHVVDGLATGVDFAVVFSDGHGQVFRTETKSKEKNEKKTKKITYFFLSKSKYVVCKNFRRRLIKDQTVDCRLSKITIGLNNYVSENHVLEKELFCLHVDLLLNVFFECTLYCKRSHILMYIYVYFCCYE